MFRNSLFLAVLSVFISTSAFAYGEWQTIGVCDGGAAVLDESWAGNSHAPAYFQLVIRDKGIVQYFENTGVAQANARGEIILPLMYSASGANTFDNSSQMGAQNFVAVNAWRNKLSVIIRKSSRSSEDLASWFFEYCQFRTYSP